MDPEAPAGSSAVDSRARVFETLEQLLALPSAEVTSALIQASNLVTRALGADKVDVFLHQPERDTMCAVGSSTQPLSSLQKRLGLDVLPVANGGRVVEVFKTGRTHHTGRLDQDRDEIVGIKEALKVRSQIAVPLIVGGKRRGVLIVCSQQPDYFQDTDVRFMEMVGRWIGMVTHRAELVEQIAANAAEQGRRTAADELVTVLAHDMRNLLLPISLRLTLMSDRASEDERVDDLQDLQQAAKGIDRLARLVSDILDTARLDRGIFTLDQRPAELIALVREVAANVGTPETPVKVLAAEPVTVVADPQRLRQALENVVSNAVQHSPAGTAVTVEVAARESASGPVALVVVRDEGPGIPSDVLPRIFDRYAVGQASQGLGLGLYLARRIAAAHGGKLDVTSEPGQGAEFIITLPAAVR